jgi:hypothetical protein
MKVIGSHILAVCVLTATFTCSNAGCSRNSTHPNLSGAWKMNMAKSKLLRDSKFQSRTLTIKQNGLDFEFWYKSDGKESLEKWRADGKERVIDDQVPGLVKSVSKTYWDGSTLVTEIKTTMLPATAAERQVNQTKIGSSLSAGGGELIEKLKWDTGQIEYVYDKQ